jgi:hypothetical protein
MAQGSTSLPMDASRALLLTDSRGQVVFADNNFIRLTRRVNPDGLVGTPLFKLIGLDQDTVTQFLREVSSSGMVAERLFDIQDMLGEPLRVTCTGVATYDDRQMFIGADVLIKPVIAVVEPAAELPPEPEPEPANTISAEELAALRLYCETQLDRLRSLVERVGGKRLHDTFNSILNEVARRNDWPVAIQNDQFYAEIQQGHADIYRALLAQAVTYSGKVIGEGPVRREIGAAEKGLAPEVVDIADKAGLRELAAGG